MTPEAHTPTALERLVREGEDADIRRLLILLQPPEVADIVEALKRPEDRTRLLRVMSGRDRSEVVRDMDEAVRTEVMDDLSVLEAAAVVGEMQSDDAADVLQGFDEVKQEAVLQQIEAGDRAELRKILTYSEDSAGGIMQTELVAVREDWTVSQAVEEIRRTRDEVGELHEIFVVDSANRLRGWVTERALILAEGQTPLAGLVRPVPASVSVTMDQEEIASLVQDYDVSSVPVVDEGNLLVGRILVDDIVDVLEEEATEDIARLGGTAPEEIYEAGMWTALRARSPWLLLTFFGGILAAQIMRMGESTIHEAGSLFAFIPVIMGMGGGCSTQAATVTVRSLALGRINVGGVWTVIRKELAVGLILAAATALLLWGAAFITSGDGRIALVAACAILGGMCFGAMFGVLTPLLFDRFGIDPAVATAPFVTTANDVLGSTLILLAAQQLL
jgi:magnesium transporter